MYSFDIEQQFFCCGREEGAGASGPERVMGNRVRGIRLAAALVLAALMLAVCGFASADADPVRVSSLCEPQSVISEQDVSITIKIYNSSQTDMQGEITLFNPAGISVEKYAGLKGEQSVTYTGTWRVTREQIEQGKIKYFIKYTVDTGSGATELTRTIPVTIQAEAAAPQLTATYAVSPVSAREGQEVTLSYTLSNTGNVELRSIVVENEGVSKEKLAQPSLSVGEKVTLTDSFTMGKKELVSKPTITYQAADSNKSLTISDMARKTITVAEDGLEVELKAESVKNLYPGEKVELTIALKNTGDGAYSGLSAALSDGTQLITGVDLKPGASREEKVQWSALGDGVISVAISGKDASGADVSVASNELEVTTMDASRALVLDVKADVESDVIYSEPAVLRFGVVVSNIGQLDATTLTIEQAGVTVAKIPSLPAGESRTVVFDLETSIAGKFQFVVKGRDADTNEKSYESNVLTVAYAAPTPAPTAVPTPTPVPPTPSPVPTATPAPTLGEVIAAKVNPVVLYSVAGVIVALLAVILTASGVSSAKRKKRMAQAIDTIELSPDVRNHRGVARRRRKQAGEKPSAKHEDPQDEVIVPATELTEEEASRMHEETTKENAQAAGEDSTPAAEPELRRRRQAVEVPTDETLRVAPVDQRPEFIAQGKVDDSQTRIFGRMAVQAAMEEEMKDAVPAVEEKAETAEPAVAMQEKQAPAAGMPAADETIRISRDQIEEIRGKQEEREDTFAAKGGKGKKRDEIKPMKKKKKGFLFGRKKAEEEDDFVEEDELDESGEDDLFE